MSFLLFMYLVGLLLGGMVGIVVWIDYIVKLGKDHRRYGYNTEIVSELRFVVFVVPILYLIWPITLGYFLMQEAIRTEFIQNLWTAIRLSIFGR